MPFRTYRHRLPHWRDDNATYFITWRLHPTKPDLDSSERTMVLDTITHFEDERFELLAAVIMNDHIHVICRPFDRFKLEKIVQAWKSVSSRNVLKDRSAKPPLWQDEYFDRIIRDQEELQQKLDYIEDNPTKRWPEIEEYQWHWFPRD